MFEFTARPLDMNFAAPQISTKNRESSPHSPIHQQIFEATQPHTHYASFAACCSDQISNDDDFFPTPFRLIHERRVDSLKTLGLSVFPGT